MFRQIRWMARSRSPIKDVNEDARNYQQTKTNEMKHVWYMVISSDGGAISCLFDIAWDLRHCLLSCRRVEKKVEGLSYFVLLHYLYLKWVNCLSHNHFKIFHKLSLVLFKKLLIKISPFIHPRIDKYRTPEDIVSFFRTDDKNYSWFSGLMYTWIYM